MLHDEISLRFLYRGDSEADEFVVTEMKYHYDFVIGVYMNMT